MAGFIEDMLADGGVFVAESGTGTGKTLAYLVPAILSGKKVLISTGTKHLQDQIYHRDLPMVRDALSSPVSTALLKGRANYLCLHRFGDLEFGDMPKDNDLKKYHRQLSEWAHTTRTGDIGEANAVPEEAAIWPHVTSTAENCLGSKCPQFDECYVRKARKAALDSDVLVVNHHLFFADLVLQDEGFGRLLPGVEAIIFDEAHQMPEIASVFFGRSVSRKQIENLARDVLAEELKEKSGVKELRLSLDKLNRSAANLRMAFGGDGVRASWEDVNDKKIHTELDKLFDALALVTNILEAASVAGDGLENCFRRAQELLDRLDRFRDGGIREHVRWFETFRHGFTLSTTPLDVSQPFLERADLEEHSWIFTSATLTINGDFAHFLSQFGLADAETHQWPSPFDFEENTLMYLPQGLPNPGEANYTELVVAAALPVIQASRGRAFMLFTSYRALNIAASLLADKIDFPLLVQGSAPKQELLQQFHAHGDAVLLGTASFWEGVDVRGDALSCVIIDKLPFAAPDDPVLRARGRALEQQGRNAFMEYQVPKAVITLKQGAGRLIRDVTDNGVLMLCDPRLLNKGYGKIFLGSLPPMPKTRELNDVNEFFNRQHASSKLPETA
ncbi:MAG: ATP-dependent DNA helicase [Acidiferrobacterales bacterium]